MPGILPPRLITTKIGTSSQSRIAQACDRCRSKKIRCDGVRPSCTQCTNVGFECKTSDKLSRRAFPRGYTESLEERVRGLETEVRELKDLLDMKDEKIDMLSRMHSPMQPAARRLSAYTPPPSNLGSDPGSPACGEVLKMQQMPHLSRVEGSEAIFMGNSSTRALVESFSHRLQETGKSADIRFDLLLPQRPLKLAPQKAPTRSSQPQQPPRVVSDQMINIFFQEWAPLFPVLHRPTLLDSYEQYVSGDLVDRKAVAQLNLIFCIAATSSEKGIAFDVSVCEKQWIAALSTFSIETSLSTVQCLILAQIYCMQKADYNKMLHYRSLAVGTSQRLGLQQAQKGFSFSVLACESRKKVFWSLYTVDCFVSSVLGLPRLIRDSDVDCEFPVDADDEYISDKGFRASPPGDSTKLSSALALFKLARVLGKVLEQNYPTASVYEVSTATISALEADLEDWSASLPSHLQLTFEKEKPSTNVISSRCPILGLTYHYTRALIHRPVALAHLGERSSLSLMALATCSKHITQVLELLEERNLCFSLCLNKSELAVLCGFESLLQAIDLPAESKLLQEAQKTTFSIMGILSRRKATAAGEFKRVAGAAMGTGSLASLPLQPVVTQTVLDTPSSIDSHGNSSDQLQEIASRYRAAVSGSMASRSPSLGSSTSQSALPSVTYHATETCAGSHQSTSKRLRALAPSKAPSTLTQKSVPGWKMNIELMKRHHASSRQGDSRDSTSLNLDFFAFSDGPQQTESTPLNTADPTSLWLTAVSESLAANQDDNNPLDWLSIDDLADEGGNAENCKVDSSSRTWQASLAPSQAGGSVDSLVNVMNDANQDSTGIFEGFDFSSMDADAAVYGLGLLSEELPRHDDLGSAEL